MRIWHRYPGYFSAGIMSVYAISGIVLIFRDTDFLKRDKRVEQKLSPNLNAGELGKALRMRDLKIGCYPKFATSGQLQRSCDLYALFRIRSKDARLRVPTD
jgi:hypothetical protein